jgi:hypothetical protein
MQSRTEVASDASLHIGSMHDATPVFSQTRAFTPVILRQQALNLFDFELNRRLTVS